MRRRMLQSVLRLAVDQRSVELSCLALLVGLFFVVILPAFLVTVLLRTFHIALMACSIAGSAFFIPYSGILPSFLFPIGPCAPSFSLSPICQCRFPASDSCPPLRHLFLSSSCSRLNAVCSPIYVLPLTPALHPSSFFFFRLSR